MLFWLNRNHISMFDFFKKKKKPETVQELLTYCEQLEERIKESEAGISRLKEHSIFPIQRMRIVRYNPFSNVGGNQSFSLALLDGKNNGIVMTSIYAADGSRIYAKPIKGGLSEFTLSKEEKEALEGALQREES